MQCSEWTRGSKDCIMWARLHHMGKGRCSWGTATHQSHSSVGASKPMWQLAIRRMCGCAALTALKKAL